MKIKGLRIMVILLVFISGCALEVDKKEQKTEMSKEKLVLWSYYETDAQKESLNQLIAGFNNSQDKYLMTWEYVPMTEFSKRIAIGITESQLPDLVIIDNPDMPSYIELEVFEEITNYITQGEIDQYYESVWQSVEQGGKIYGVPFCTNNLALIYNRDILAENQLEPPQDWEEFMRAAQIMTNHSRYGFSMSGVSGEQSAFQLLSWILASGEKIETLGSTYTIMGLERISEMVSKRVMPIESINWSQNDVARKFAEGKLAMMENGPWILPIIKEAGINYGIIQLPYEQSEVTIIGGENLCLIKGKHLEGSIEFMNYYNQEDVMLKVCKSAYVIPPKMKQAEQLASENPDYAIFIEKIASSISRAAIDNWREKSKELSQVMYDLLSGEKTPRQAADELKKVR